MHGLILGTFLPPTRGHQQLVQFAYEYLKAQCEEQFLTLTIMVCSRDREPLDGAIRTKLFEKQFAHYGNKINVVHFQDDDAPQNPKDENDIAFWQYWKEAIEEIYYNGPGRPDIIFASETYGKNLAELFNVKFVPFNMYRQTVSISGTQIRNDPLKNFHMLMPETQKYLRKTITLFGAESTGKTTLSRVLSDQMNGHFVPEWAREYLEQHTSPDVTDDKMFTIAHAQFASQMAAKTLENKPFIFQDTDILSTIGYYRIYNGKEPEFIRELFNNSKSDLYVVMNSDIPFEEDALRYGGKSRESTDSFWINLLDEFNCNYYVVKNTNLINQVDEITKECNKLFLDNRLYSFKRDQDDQDE